MAWTLNERQKYLCKISINKVLNQLDSAYLEEHIIDVSRIPGFATMLLIDPNTSFPRDVREKMENLLGEQVLLTIDSKNKLSILSQSIGKNCEKKRISIEEKTRVAYIPVNDFDQGTKLRVRLAQQLIGLHIMNNERS